MKRTIETILNLHTGELLEADDVFKDAKQQEDVIFRFRTELQTQFEKDEKIYVCIFCKQSVGIRGKKDKSDFYFAHNYNSEDCIIKTGSALTFEEIRCIKYNGVKESEEHHLIKNQIAYALEHDPLVTKVETERVFKDLSISKNWKKPDVLATLPDKKIAFELQLSTTFLSVIVSRTIFYKERGVYLIWIFPTFSLDADLQKFTQKDVYYTNAFNVYVFDQEAAKLSDAEQKLMLKCFFKKFSIHNEQLVTSWEQTFISMHDLNFNALDFTAWYYNSYLEKESALKELALQKQALILREEEAEANYNSKKTIEYLRKFYKSNAKPWSPYDEDTPANEPKSELEINLINKQLGFNDTKADFIANLFVSGDKSEFLRYICEQDFIKINMENVIVKGGTIFTYLLDLEDKWEFHQKMKLLFRSGYKMTASDFSHHDELYGTYYFNQSEHEREAIIRWAYVYFLNSIWYSHNIYEAVEIRKIIYAILSVKNNLSIGYKFANMRQHAINFLDNYAAYGHLYIGALKYYRRYEQLLLEDKRGKLKGKIEKFLNDDPKQKYNSLIFNVFPELQVTTPIFDLCLPHSIL